MSVMSLFSLDDLRVLLAFADTESVTKAGEALGIKQPTATRHLDSFRGTKPLISKVGGGLKLTNRGRAVLPAARSIIRQYDHLQSYIQGQSSHPHQLCIAAGSIASQWFLAAAIAEMANQFPDWEVCTRIIRGENRIVGTADGTLDLAIVSHSRMQIENIVRWTIGTDNDLTYSELDIQCLCIAAGRGTQQADELEAILSAHEVPLNTLARWNLIGLDENSGIRRQLDSLAIGNGIQLRFSIEAGGWGACKEFAKHGLGVAVIPLATVRHEDLERLVIRKLTSEVYIRYALIYRFDDERPGLKALVTCIQQGAQNHAEKVARQWSGVLGSLGKDRESKR